MDALRRDTDMTLFLWGYRQNDRKGEMAKHGFLMQEIGSCFPTILQSHVDYCFSRA